MTGEAAATAANTGEGDQEAAGGSDQETEVPGGAEAAGAVRLAGGVS